MLKMKVLAVVILSMCVAQSCAELPGCDKEIINKIEALWEIKGMPRNVLGTLNRKGTGSLLYSTDVVPLEALPIDKPKCIKGEFTLASTKFSVVPQSGTLDASKAIVSHKATEKKGVVSEDGGSAVKYIVSNKYGVTSFYSCIPNGGKSGPPAAGLAVAIEKFDTATPYIAEAKDDLTDLGITLKTKYENDCFK